MMLAPLMLSDAEVAAALDVNTAFATQRAAFEALGRGTARLAKKVALPRPTDGSVAICYLSRLSADHGPVCKLMAVQPSNPARGLPTISATVLVLDADTGRAVAVLEADALTELRTAAGSAVAADALARPDADQLAVLGSGVQGKAHVRALSQVRRLRQVRIWSPNPQHRTRAADELADELALDVVASTSPAEAVRAAPLVVTCTLSTEPVVSTEHLAPGATVLSVGSFEAHRCEVSGALVRAARVVVDDIPTALEQAGPVVRGIASGDLRESELVSLGEVLIGRATGRADPSELVFYNSVGLGVQDAAAAHAVLARAYPDYRMMAIESTTTKDS